MLAHFAYVLKNQFYTLGSEKFCRIFNYLLNQCPKTAEGYIFPATFYYGKSGTSLGGWHMARIKERFSPDFYSIINFSPFNFTPNELDDFIEALEISLRMVPMTDYYGVNKGDDGYTIMGVKDGNPYILDLGWSYDERKKDQYLKFAQQSI